MNSPTRSLLEAASQGDAPSIDTLLDRHLSGVHAFIRLKAGRLILAKESSADLVQSVCREILEDIDDFEWRGDAQFRHWLYLTAERKVLDRGRSWSRGKRDPHKEAPPIRRSDSRSDRGDLGEGLSILCSPSAGLRTQEELDRLEGCFEQLSEDYREVILLTRFVGLSRAEAAEQMDRSPAALRVLLHRALARLSTLLDETSTARES